MATDKANIANGLATGTVVCVTLAMTACGGDDDASTPTSGGAATAATVSPAAAQPTTSPAVSPTPTEAAANTFGVRVATLDTVGAADDDKLTLPAAGPQIDKLQVADLLNASYTSLFIGIVDGVVLAPAPGTIVEDLTSNGHQLQQRRVPGSLSSEGRPPA